MEKEGISGEVVTKEGETAPVPMPEPVKKLVKRNVALHTGYVGTGYKGSSINRTLSDEACTIEHVLENALYKAGMIMDLNFGQFWKIKWSRASRTDKGVHSLGTVMAAKLEVEDEAYETDPEGLGYAEKINANLPPTIQVIAVQKVNKKFNARHSCSGRTYEYYLPASMLGLKCDGSDEDAVILKKFRSALSQFCGYHPFHNYTKFTGVADNPRKPLKAKPDRKREVWGPRAQAGGEGKTVAPIVATDAKEAAEGDGGAVGDGQVLEDGGVSGDVEVVGDKGAVGEVEPVAKRQRVHVEDMQESDAESDDDDGPGGELDDEDEEDYIEVVKEGCVEGEKEEVGDEKHKLGTSRGLPKKSSRGLKWISKDDPSTRVLRTFYRNVEYFKAEDPQPLIEGGTPCLRLEVQGISFMLHHIRHMIGTAVAVALDLISPELLEASLSAPSRVSLPRAPPHTLLLSDCSFHPFRKPSDGKEVAFIRISGESLTMREGAKALKEKFRRDVLLPALEHLVELDEWDKWKTSLMVHYPYPAEALEAFMTECNTWGEMMKAKRIAKEKQFASESLQGRQGGGGRGGRGGRGWGGGRGRGHGKRKF